MRLFGRETPRVALRPTPFLRRLSGEAWQPPDVTAASPSTASPISTTQTWAPVNTVANHDDVHELINRIRFLSSMGTDDDRPLILEVCDRVNSDATSREAVRALSHEFKHGSAAAQLSAARLWAILLRNSSTSFVAQSTAPDFLETIAEVIRSPQTAQVVRHRVLRVLGDAVYSNPGSDAFRALWVQVKPADQPEHGSPYNDHDATLRPSLRHQFRPQSILDRLSPPANSYGYQGIDSRFPYEWEAPPPSYEASTGTFISTSSGNDSTPSSPVSPSSARSSVQQIQSQERRTSSQSDYSDTFLDIESDGEGDDGVGDSVSSEAWSIVALRSASPPSNSSTSSSSSSHQAMPVAAPPPVPVPVTVQAHAHEQLMVVNTPPRGPRLKISTPRLRQGNASASPSPVSSPESPTPNTARPGGTPIRRLPPIGPANVNRTPTLPAAETLPPLPSLHFQSFSVNEQSVPFPIPAARRLPLIQAGGSRTNIPHEISVPSSSSPRRKSTPASPFHKEKGIYLCTFRYLKSVASDDQHRGALASLQVFKRVMGDIDTVSSLVYSWKYRDTLIQVSNTLGVAEDPELKDALEEDQAGVADILLDVLYSPADEAAVLALDGDAAQSVLDIVQDTLDRALLNSREATSKARRLIGKLAKACNKLPSSLIISGVTDRDEDASFSGGFGDVYKAIYRGKPVALKKMRMFQTTDQQDIRRKFFREALTWKRLSHAYIMPLIGIDTESFPSCLSMVSPWMKNGTVVKYLSGISDPLQRQRTVDRLIQEIAQGLAFLHDQKVVHGDLRGSNILVDDDGHAQLADFGLTVLSDSTTTQTNNGAGSVRWMAPEALHPEACGLPDFVRRPPSDIYAFGCVCLELYTGYPPFHHELLHDAPVMLQVMARCRPSRPAGHVIPDQIWNIMQRCWAHEYAQRPSIIDIVLELGVSQINADDGMDVDSPDIREDVWMNSPSADSDDQYEGWVARAVSPLTEFIDMAVNPRHHYLDLQEIADGPGGTTLYVARLAEDRYEELTLPDSIRAGDQKNIQARRPTFVAIKAVPIMPTGSAKLVEVLRELRTMRGVECGNILGMDALYVDPVEDQLWIRMELMTRTLSSVVALNAAGLILSDRIIAGCIKDILLALENLAANGVTPRDLRAENVLINSEGVLKLTNLAHTIQIRELETSWRPRFSGPRSLGALVRELASGRRPPLSAERHNTEDWLSHPSLASRSPSFHEFIRMCEDFDVRNSGYRKLIETSFVQNACERPALAQLLVQCTAFEGRLREQRRRG
ncbi:kinase-like domain-containing protein [Roridomyces roridus]|uniref:Kinase-like domain-containing protein n=1 Tax=Roridomyces roridus TaxID=1738132 RepID=A0AAD7BCC5_9AGAR|nr:kinase-like domain-containing protein [Roridomyces roridus]